ncbi:hypothetical protein JTE90_005553 [Oedothorax gibbosus]|uniref:Uncharacterized protein n=1 Tax=Oedothorax gibbosus TaxID=931172 RepID=A0AAV6V9B6_9ARAC|nr:hypothetical protein JTE90_005553 [Oedothorax gibbosus]
MVDPTSAPEPHLAPNVRGIVFSSLIVLAAVVLLIVIIVTIVYAVKGAKLKKEIAKSSNSVPLQSISSSVPNASTVPRGTDVPRQPPTVPSQDTSFYNRVRRSFRGERASTNVETHAVQQYSNESYQVPSMYPSLEVTQDMYGVDNKNFKIEE